MIGLVDCNNFFVSCERVFQPSLQGKAVVVLSGNDGCVVARSNEAKAMGIKMGEPFFRVKYLVDAGQLEVRSSNFALYGDMSRRVMSVIRRFVPRIEVYSIDECFLDLDGFSNLQALGREISETVKKWTGIPVSVGIAKTKTLAKVASKFAKKYPGYHGCAMIADEQSRVKALQLFPIGDVWGVGRRNLQRLENLGVHTAYDLTLWREGKVRAILALPGIRMWRELRGLPSIPIETPTAKKSLTTSRTFKQGITDLPTLRSLVADFASLCAERLRKESSAAAQITTYITTDRFRTDLPQYANSATIRLDVATSDVREIIKAATQCLETIFETGYQYKKAGVMLSDIEHGAVQGNLFDTTDHEKQNRLLKTIDKIKEKNGNLAIRVASQTDSREAINKKYQSRCYTTRLSDIIEVGTKE